MAVARVTVGIDASSAARDALTWASRFATAVDASLRAVRSWQMPMVTSLPTLIKNLPTEEFMERQSAEELDDVLADASLTFEVDKVTCQGSPGPVLVEEAQRSDLLVVGRTGRGRRHGVSRFAEVVLGSTARYCVHHATCPVAAVPADANWSDEPRVVVGIDGSASSIEALRWAVENLPAAAQIEAVWALPYWGEGLIAVDTELFEHAQRGARDELDACVAAAGGQERNPPVAARVEPGTPREVLTDTATAADIVVVGDRGRTGVAARVLGSVTDHVLRYAPCPVIVVPMVHG